MRLRSLLLVLLVSAGHTRLPAQLPLLTAPRGTLRIEFGGGFFPATSAWIDGSKPNYGLVLLNSATLTGAPASPGDVIARYAAHEFTGFAGPQLIVSHAPLNMPGDFNNDHIVDARDYVVWRKTIGQVVAVGTSADGNRNGLIDQNDYQVWRQNFGAIGAGSGVSGTELPVPEPNTSYLVLIALLAKAPIRLRARRA
jgi:hypothetical protein